MVVGRGTAEMCGLKKLHDLPELFVSASSSLASTTAATAPSLSGEGRIGEVMKPPRPPGCVMLTMGKAGVMAFFGPLLPDEGILLVISNDRSDAVAVGYCQLGLHSPQKEVKCEDTLETCSKTAKLVCRLEHYL